MIRQNKLDFKFSHGAIGAIGADHELVIAPKKITCQIVMFYTLIGEVRQNCLLVGRGQRLVVMRLEKQIVLLFMATDARRATYVMGGRGWAHFRSTIQSPEPADNDDGPNQRDDPRQMTSERLG